MILSNRGNTDRYHVSSPDFQLTPRFALSETENSAHLFDVTWADESVVRRRRAMSHCPRCLAFSGPARDRPSVVDSARERV